MKVTALKENLHRPLTVLSRYINTRPALPVLANILIEATEEGLILSTTNLDVTVKAKVLAKTEQAGQITVPARLLSELVATLPAGNIKFSSTDSQLILASSTTEASLNTIPAADFPVLPVFNQQDAVSIPLSLLNEVAQKVLFAAATDESRPVLTTLMLQPQTDNLTFVATDGFRLSEAVKTASNLNLDTNKPLLLPAKIMGEMIRLGNDMQADHLWIDITTQANQIAMKVGEIEFFSKFIDAAYPEYKRIIPTEFVSNLEVDSEDLLQAVKLASVFAKDAGSLIKFEVNPTSGELKIGAQSAALGQNHSTLSVAGDGEEMAIAFNARFLLDALNAFSNGKLLVKFKGPLAPMLIQEPDKSDFRHIIMPIKVEG